MTTPFVLVDRTRAQQIALLGAGHHLFANYTTWIDAAGIPWAVERSGDLVLAVTWLGPGWVVNPYARQRRAEELAARHQKLTQASPADHQRELAAAVGILRLGELAERVCLALHRAVLEARCSTFRLPDCALARATWGRQQQTWPCRWRRDLRLILRGLCWLHLASWPENGQPVLGETTALLTHAADLAGLPADTCDEQCPGWGGPRHHHFLLNLGRGFLGTAERFAAENETPGVRYYLFPRSGPREGGPTLQQVGKEGNLVSIFLPAKLGEPESCRVFNPRQHRLLQALVRETTRAPKRQRKDLSETEVWQGNQLPNLAGRQLVPCSLLPPAGQHVAFNGNGCRRRLGYLLTSPGGWLVKAGYALKDVQVFLDDLAGLVPPLGLIVVGLCGRNPDWLTLQQLQDLAVTQRGRQRLDKVHLRVYTAPDYESRWNAHFGWTGLETAPAVIASQPADNLLIELKRRGLTQKALAVGLGADPALLCKLLQGKKPWPAGWLERARDWLASQGALAPRPEPAQPIPVHLPVAAPATLDSALAHLRRGWSVLPQVPGTAKPHVRWKPFQTQLPSAVELLGWYEHWPLAGLTVVLGPISDLVILTVQGSQAQAILLKYLGSEPSAPRINAGAEEYRLLFRCPALPTRAVQTLWERHLILRGAGALELLPPSVGERGPCTWAPGRSPEDVPVPHLPEPILAALGACQAAATAAIAQPNQEPGRANQGASDSTREFLEGRWANGPFWNRRLFQAACDLSARGRPLEQAEPLLLAGARPRDEVQQGIARRTIKSAYSRQRAPSQC